MISVLSYFECSGLFHCCSNSLQNLSDINSSSVGTQFPHFVGATRSSKNAQCRRFRWKYPWTIFGFGATVTGCWKGWGVANMVVPLRDSMGNPRKKSYRNTWDLCCLPPQNDWALVGILRYVFTWSNIECCGIRLDTSPTGFIYTSLDLNCPRRPNSSKYLLRFFKSILGVQLASDQVFGCLGFCEHIWPFPWMVWSSQSHGSYPFGNIHYQVQASFATGTSAPRLQKRALEFKDTPKIDRSFFFHTRGILLENDRFVPEN